MGDEAKGDEAMKQPYTTLYHPIPPYTKAMGEEVIRR
jgi:hypothetical protein